MTSASVTLAWSPSGRPILLAAATSPSGELEVAVIDPLEVYEPAAEEAG